MEFSDKNSVISYVDKLIKKGIKLEYSKTKRLLDINNISIDSIILKESENHEDNLVLAIYNFNSDNATVDLEISQESWIMYLPKIYQNNSVLKKFLYGFQVSYFQQSQIVENVNDIFIPQKTEFLDWLASWFGVKFSINIEAKIKREFIHKLINLYKIRGTEEYLITMVKILTEQDITIIDRFIPEYLYNSDNYESENYNKQISFTVVISNKIDEDKDIETAILKKIYSIISKEKPAFSQYFIDYKFLQADKEENDTKGIFVDQSNLINYHEHENYDIDELKELNRVKKRENSKNLLKSEYDDYFNDEENEPDEVDKIETSSDDDYDDYDDYD